MSKIVSLHYMRGIAAFIVMIQHVVVLSRVSHTTEIPHYLGANFEKHLVPTSLIGGSWLHDFVIPFFRMNFYGALGVSIFFLISGYVIAMSLNGVRKPVNFLKARALRIYPTLWVTNLIILGIIYLTAATTASPFPFDFTTISLNFLNLQSFAAKSPVNPVLWTLLVEELFYLLIYLQILRGENIGLKSIFLCLVGLTGVVSSRTYIFESLSFTHPALDFLAYCSVFICFILIGCLTYIYDREEKLRLSRDNLKNLGLFLLLFSACFAVFELNIALFNKVNPTLGRDVLPTKVYLCAALLFLFLLKWRNLPQDIGVLNFLANISYPLYLLHTIVGWTAVYVLSRVTGSLYFSLGVSMCLCIGLSYLTHIVIEKRSLKWSKRVKNS